MIIGLHVTWWDGHRKRHGIFRGDSGQLALYVREIDGCHRTISIFDVDKLRHPRRLSNYSADSYT